MKKKNNSVLLSGLLVIATQPFSALAMHHGGHGAPGAGHGSVPHVAAPPHASAPRVPAIHVPGAGSGSSRQPSPGRVTHPVGGSPRPGGGSPRPGSSSGSGSPRQPSPGHVRQPGHPSGPSIGSGSPRPGHSAGPGHAVGAPPSGHVPGHAIAPAPGIHHPVGRPAEGRPHWGGRPAPGARRVWGRPAFGGHVRYMPPHHRHFTHMNLAPGILYPIVGYPSFYLYNGAWIYRSDSGSCYDELGNEVSVEPGVQEGTEIDAEISGCC